MSRRAALVYHDAMSQHSLGPAHPMRPVRLRHTFDLMSAYGLPRLPNVSLVLPRDARDAEVESFHTPEYLQAVKAFSQGDRLEERPAFNFADNSDNPTYEGMYDAAALSTGASVKAAELLLEGRADVAFNVSGGLHHAMDDHASGFCVFNDPVVAINTMTARGLKVMYVDIDAHHGDGVQAAFYNTDQVLTLSMHESGRYLFPGTGAVEELGIGRGKGYSVNVPLAPHTGDDVFRWAFEEVAPPIARAFKPDVIATQLGIDPYFNDPLTHLQLTIQGHAQLVQRLGELSPGMWLAFGGGGYDLMAVARAWTLDLAVMAEHSLDDDIPASFLQGRQGVDKLRDWELPDVPEDVMPRTLLHAQQSVREVQQAVFPALGIAGI